MSYELMYISAKAEMFLNPREAWISPDEVGSHISEGNISLALCANFTAASAACPAVFEV